MMCKTSLPKDEDCLQSSFCLSGSMKWMPSSAGFKMIIYTKEGIPPILAKSMDQTSAFWEQSSEFPSQTQAPRTLAGVSRLDKASVYRVVSTTDLQWVLWSSFSSESSRRICRWISTGKMVYMTRTGNC